jgi:hypothetical protein
VAEGTHNGQPRGLLTVIDEFTRESLTIQVGRRLTAEDAQESLS